MGHHHPHDHHGLQHGRRRRVLTAFVTWFKSDGGSVRFPRIEAPSPVRAICDLSACDRPASGSFDSARPDSVLYICDQHASEVRKWVG
jgi:hypothetical protein